MWIIDHTTFYLQLYSYIYKKYRTIMHHKKYNIIISICKLLILIIFTISTKLNVKRIYITNFALNASSDYTEMKKIKLVY